MNLTLIIHMKKLPVIPHMVPKAGYGTYKRKNPPMPHSSKGKTEIGQRQRRKAGTKILMRLLKQFLELVSVFKEARKLYDYFSLL